MELPNKEGKSSRNKWEQDSRIRKGQNSACFLFGRRGLGASWGQQKGPCCVVRPSEPQTSLPHAQVQEKQRQQEFFRLPLWMESREVC